MNLRFAAAPLSPLEGEMSALADRGGWQRFNTAETLLQADRQLPPSAPCRGHLPLKGERNWCLTGSPL